MTKSVAGAKLFTSGGDSRYIKKGENIMDKILEDIKALLMQLIEALKDLLFSKIGDIEINV